MNHGDGPLNHFDVKVEFLARASAVSITNHADLGNCWVQGAASVRNTTVQCAEDISVFDVSDEVSITNTETMHDADTAAVTLRMVGITPGTRGGKVTGRFRHHSRDLSENGRLRFECAVAGQRDRPGGRRAAELRKAASVAERKDDPLRQRAGLRAHRGIEPEPSRQDAAGQ